MDHRDGISPIALTGNAPIAQAVSDCRVSPAVFGNVCADLFLGFFAILAIKMSGVCDDTGLYIGFIHLFEDEALLWILDDDLHGNIILFGELKVALIMRRNCHHCTRAIIHEHIVCNPDLHLIAGKWIDAISAAKDAFFDGFSAATAVFVFIDYSLTEVVKLGIIRFLGEPALNEGMLRRKRHEGDAIDGIRAGSKYADFLICAF